MHFCLNSSHLAKTLQSLLIKRATMIKLESSGHFLDITVTSCQLLTYLLLTAAAVLHTHTHSHRHIPLSAIRPACKVGQRRGWTGRFVRWRHQVRWFGRCPRMMAKLNVRIMFTTCRQTDRQSDRQTDRQIVELSSLPSVYQFSWPVYQTVSLSVKLPASLSAC